MKALVIYDSNFGNTKKIAVIVAANLGKNIKAVAVTDVGKKDLKKLDVLVVGSPVIGWSPSEKLGRFLEELKPGYFKGVKATSFDTRLKLLFFTNAATRISKKLKAAGAEIIVKPRAFFVIKGEGPLQEGELERAASWALKIKKVAKSKIKEK
ncbi:MAG: flavodoxin domain-containing protein [Anaerolineaceae bacterium]|nr:flavodoxin domain-containing protein [Anaerolineaceae bacterium]